MNPNSLGSLLTGRLGGETRIACPEEPSVSLVEQILLYQQIDYASPALESEQLFPRCLKLSNRSAARSVILSKSEEVGPQWMEME